MDVNLSPLAGAAAQLLDNNGDPLSGGQIFTYVAGTTTPLSTYTSSAGTTPHTNPIILDSAGRVPGGEIWLDNSASYKFIVKTSDAVLIGSYDDISQVSTNADNVTYDPPFAGGVATTVENKLAQYLSVKDFGATGDGVTDDTAAIQAAVNFASTGGKGSVVYFPPGIYRTTQTIIVDASGVVLEGAERIGALNYGPMQYAGSMIYYTANDGGTIVQIGANTQVRYFNELRNLRIGAAASVTLKPVGLLLAGLSEIVLKSVSVNGNCSVGYSFVSVGIGSITDFYVGGCDIGVRFDASGPTPFVSCVNLWFSGGNIWQSTDDAVQFNCSTRQIVFRDSWIEYAPNAFHFKQIAAKNIYPEVFLYNVEFSSAAPGPLDSRFLRATALAGSANDLRVFAYINDCRTFNSGATYNVEFTKGTNTSPNSFFDQMQFNNCIFYGASASVVKSDTSSTTVFATGRLVKTSAFGGGSVIPLTDGTARQHSLTTAFGYWDMVDSLPLRLPTQGALSYGTAGQVWFETLNRIGYSAAGWRVLLPRPQVATYEDESITVTVTDSAETLRFNTPLTANRTVTLSVAGAYNGAKFRVVRAAGATGAFTLSVGGLKTLAVNEWCDVEHNGTVWVLTAYGTL